ncbi:conserved protein of unknown function [Candidatus Hydrogenisulfobacillus filiaventi]|uniref:Phosphoribosyl-ATP pyrophosphohydrolase n=1 Tax=Candidatus Hydrogenisulfobacillus filiaventi TaxID=2707344 RepID=A0A6F8ZF45_9FIRM|nr:nucleoside triphosphate pyrophosphohydrolase [Bacillota bacterium]CAB1128314.1 conserved protein of unknown function [Candidatus Hydrogenisulfobacillus filiaventi]
MTVYNKLVRDRIPDIIAAAGGRCEVRELPPEEYRRALSDKLLEEAQEYRTDGTLEELADVLEVLQALVRASGATWQELEDLRRTKAAARGGFDRRLWLVWADPRA